MDGRRTEGCISSRYHFSFLNGRRSPPARAYVAVSFEQVNTEKVYADTLLGFRQAEKKKKKDYGKIRHSGVFPRGPGCVARGFEYFPRKCRMMPLRLFRR